MNLFATRMKCIAIDGNSKNKEIEISFFYPIIFCIKRMKVQKIKNERKYLKHIVIQALNWNKNLSFQFKLWLFMNQLAAQRDDKHQQQQNSEQRMWNENS